MSDEKEVTYLGDVQRLCLNADDIVVLSTDKVISQEQARQLRDQVGTVIPGHKVLVLDASMKIGVMGSEKS